MSSPTFLAGMHDPDAAIVEPARLAWGLRDACLRSGVRIAEQTPVTSLARAGSGVGVHTVDGRVHAARVVLATNAYPPLLRRLRLMTVPVYDYALMTEPLTPEQRASIGWEGREGISDTGNQFHYFRTTRDGRILWGGYDAIYHFASGISEEYDERPETFEVLARNFFATFPQLSGLRFTHAWGGVIDTCTRFAAFYGTAFDGRVGYALGFTGLGVAATRFAGDVVLDLLVGAGHCAHEARDGPQEARAVPARAVPLGRHRGHPSLARPRGRERRQGEPLAQGDGQAGVRLRLLGSRGQQRGMATTRRSGVGESARLPAAPRPAARLRSSSWRPSAPAGASACCTAVTVEGAELAAVEVHRQCLQAHVRDRLAEVVLARTPRSPSRCPRHSGGRR